MSAAEACGGRYDILPMSTGEVLQLAAGRLSGPHAAAGGFLDALDAWWRELRIDGAAAAELPFTGGWLLYLGYELAAEIEPGLHLPACPDAVTALAVRTPAAWIHERESGRAWLVAEDGAEPLLAAFEARVLTLQRAGAERGRGTPADAPPVAGRPTIREAPPAGFTAAVERALGHIAAGDVYQANLSRRWEVISPLPPDPTAVYRRLRASNPGPFSALMRHGDFAVMSSSPERLLAIRGGIASTRPIAGTRPRGATAEADLHLRAALLASEKERAEHVMLIDLERNDLGRVCVGGTVRVDEYMTLETYAHVHHIVSNVSGVLRADVTPVDAIRALFPGGTITGCPKVRCMQIIAALEGAGRGAYTGSIGYLNRGGGCDLNILIRTLTADLSPGAAVSMSFRAGAGIVADSRPLDELAETRAKALGLLRALDAAQ